MRRPGASGPPSGPAPAAARMASAGIAVKNTQRRMFASIVRSARKLYQRPAFVKRRRRAVAGLRVVRPVRRRRRASTLGARGPAEVISAFHGEGHEPDEAASWEKRSRHHHRWLPHLGGGG